MADPASAAFLRRMDRPHRIPARAGALHQRHGQVDRPVRAPTFRRALVEGEGRPRITRGAVAGLQDEAEAHLRPQIAALGRLPIQGDGLVSPAGRGQRAGEERGEMRHLGMRGAGLSTGEDGGCGIGREFGKRDARHVRRRVAGMRGGALAHRLRLRPDLVGRRQALEKTTGLLDM